MYKTSAQQAYAEFVKLGISGNLMTRVVRNKIKQLTGSPFTREFGKVHGKILNDAARRSVGYVNAAKRLQEESPYTKFWPNMSDPHMSSKIREFLKAPL